MEEAELSIEEQEQQQQQQQPPTEQQQHPPAVILREKKHINTSSTGYATLTVPSQSHLPRPESTTLCGIITDNCDPRHSLALLLNEDDQIFKDCPKLKAPKKFSTISAATQSSLIATISPSFISDRVTTMPGAPESSNTTSPENQSQPTSRDRTLRFGACIDSDRLQCFNNAKFFLLCACAAGFGNSFVRLGISFSVLTSIEKQFGYTSAHVATFTTIGSVAFGVCSIFVGYLCLSHKPRFISLGLLVMALGAIAMSVPKFIIGTYEAGTVRTSDYCSRGNSTSRDPLCHGETDWYYNLLFVVGEVMLASGCVPLFVLVPAHINDVTTSEQCGLYLGLYWGVYTLGNAVGYAVGMPVLNVWVDIQQPKTSALKSTDPNWLGAWWLGYWISAAVLFLPFIPLLGFPREFPNSRYLRMRKRRDADFTEEDRTLNQDLKSAWPCAKALLKNPVFVLICLAIASENFAMKGMQTFMVKHIQTQFNLPASDAALHTGVMVIIGSFTGMFGGGYLIKRYKWNSKEILKFATIIAFAATLFTAISLVGCSDEKVVGHREWDGTIGNLDSLSSTCNNNCQCSKKYKPICTEKDEEIYYSPCHAGCYENKQSMKGVYHNCTCFPDDIAKDGRCTKDCFLYPLFFIGTMTGLMLHCMNIVPNQVATMRVVSSGQAALAMSFQEVLRCFLADVPAPALFGSLLDKSCYLWQSDECSGENSNCLEYDREDFRWYIFALVSSTKLASFIFMLLAYKLYRLPRRGITVQQSQPAGPAVITSAENT